MSTAVVCRDCAIPYPLGWPAGGCPNCGCHEPTEAVSVETSETTPDDSAQVPAAGRSRGRRPKVSG